MTHLYLCLRSFCNLASKKHLHAALLSAIALLANPLLSAQALHFGFAQSYYPASTIGPVAVDANGVVYTGGNEGIVYKETPVPNTDNYVESVVTNSLTYVSGLAVDSVGNVYVAGTQSSTFVLLKETPSGGSYVESVVDPAASPNAVAVDSAGNLYVADGMSLVKETPSGNTYVRSVIASGFTLNLEIRGVAVDGLGNVFASDIDGYSVHKFSPNGSGGYNEVAPALTSYLDPIDLAADAVGNVYVSGGRDYDALIKLSPAPGGTYTSTTIVQLDASSVFFPSFGPVAVDGHGLIYSSSINGPSGSPLMKVQTGSVDMGKVPVGTTGRTYSLSFVASTNVTLNSTTPFQVLTGGATGLDFKDAGTGTCNQREGEPYNNSYGGGDVCTVDITFTPSTAGERQGAVVFYDTTGKPIATAYVHGTGLAPQIGLVTGSPSIVGCCMSSPDHEPEIGNVAVGGDGTIYITNKGHLSQSKTPIDIPTPVSVDDLALDGAGNIFILNRSSGQIYELSGQDRSVTTLVDSGLSSPLDIAVDSKGNVYVTTVGDGGIYKESLVGATWARSTITTGLTYPTGITVNANGDVYVATGDGNILKETYANGTYTPSTFATNLRAQDLAIDGVGDVYASSLDQEKITRITPSGAAVTLLSADVTPQDIAVAPNGTVYFVSAGVQVFSLDVTNPGPIAFASTAVGGTSSDSPRPVIVVNNGNQPLLFPAPGSGTNPSISANFEMVSPAGMGCSIASGSAAALAANNACTLNLSFMPIVAGSISGSLQFTDNSLGTTGAMQSITLNGTGTSTGLHQTSTVVSLGAASIPLGQAEVLTATVTAVGATNPIGTVTFTDTFNGTTQIIGQAPVNSGVAQLGYQPAAIGYHTIKASFAPTDSSQFVASADVYGKTITVQKIPPQLALTIPQRTYGDAAFFLTPSSNSPGTITFTVLSGPGQIYGQRLLVTGAGKIVVQATQAATSTYAAATVNAICVVAQEHQTITFDAPPSRATVGANPIALKASASSGLPITFSVLSGLASIVDNKLVLNGPGTVVVAAQQLGDANYIASQRIPYTIIVNPAPTH